MTPKQLIRKLERAIKKRDRFLILEIYEENNVDWEATSDELFEKWDELIDIANSILES